MRIKIIKSIFTISYFAILSYLVFFLGRRKGAYSIGINLVPIRNTMREYKLIHEIGTFNYFSNIFGNILLFMPLPIILKTVLGIGRFSRILLLSVLLSFTIELLQYVLKLGVADIDDIILNTTGVIVGYLLIPFFKKTIGPTIL